jgi:hypothetical protein
MSGSKSRRVFYKYLFECIDRTRASSVESHLSGGAAAPDESTAPYTVSVDAEAGYFGIVVEMPAWRLWFSVFFSLSASASAERHSMALDAYSNDVVIVLMTVMMFDLIDDGLDNAMNHSSFVP